MRFPLRIENQVGYHVSGWMIFIIYEVSFVELIRGASITTSVWSGYVIPYFINIGLFYFHAFVTMEKGWGRKPHSISVFIFLILVELAVYHFLMGTKDWFLSGFRSDPFSSIFSTKIKFIQQLWRGFYFLIFSTAFWLIGRSFKNEQRLKEAETKALLKQQEKKELELELVSTQNAFLQSQINPHLLFNTLNFIHSEVQQVSPKASDAIITLSDMMRYSIAEIKADGKVELEKEVEQIENLIRINQFRFNNKLCILLTTEGEFAPFKIRPLLLVPFVENLFKYAELTDETNPVRISVKRVSNLLQFETNNKKRTTANFRSPGIGIKNVKTRLNSFYPNRFTLNIKEDETSFFVNLTIEL